MRQSSGSIARDLVHDACVHLGHQFETAVNIAYRIEAQAFRRCCLFE